jgi:hypothetical protein
MAGSTAPLETGQVQWVSPEEIRAARVAREAARSERAAAAARTRLIVVAIWALAVAMAVGLAVLAMVSRPPAPRVFGGSGAIG